MKLAIHSDLHLEGNRLPEGFGTDEEIDVVVLAGDIGVHDLDKNLKSIVDAYLNAKYFIFVPGNHEFYHHEWFERWDQMSDICDSLGIILMDNGVALKIDDYLFIGSTCWSDMSSVRGYVDELDENQVQRGVSDFHYIRVGNDKFKVVDMIGRSAIEKADIEHLLIYAKENNLKVVVTSHFPPLLEVGNPIFPKDAFTGYFHNDWSDLFVKYKPLAWVYGHIHYNSPVKEFCGTMLLTNQRGYNKEKSNLSYNPNYIIEI